MEFRPLQHIQNRRLLTGGSHAPGYTPHEGFPTLSASSFLRNLPAVFHAGALMGLPLQGFPPAQSRTCLQARAPVPLRNLPAFCSEEQEVRRDRSAAARYSLTQVRMRRRSRGTSAAPIPSWG